MSGFLKHIRKSVDGTKHWRLTAAVEVANPCRKSMPGSCLILMTLLAFVTLTGCGGKQNESPADEHSNSLNSNGIEEVADEVTALPDIPAWFEDVSNELGIEAALQLGKLDDYFFPDIMCGGAAFVDVNNDDRLDIVLVQAGSNRSMKNPTTGTNPSGKNRLFVQQPDGKFLDRTDVSGLGDESYGMGIAVGDLNNDGWQDIYISNYGPDRLFLNRGDGTFQDITIESGIDNPHWSASVCFVDFNRDGWLDIYVTNYVDYHATNRCYELDETPDYCSPNAFNAVPDRLFLNQGLTAEVGSEANPNKIPRFENVSDSSQVGLKQGPGLGVISGDWNDDGWPDLYVANDGTANFLWINEQNGTFTDQAVLRGCAYDPNGIGQAGMGLTSADVDGNSTFDLAITHLDQENNALYLRNKLGSFEDATRRWGWSKISETFTGFGIAVVDFDLDSNLDIAVVNGRVTAGKKNAPNEFWDRYRERNHLLVNRGDKTFSERKSKAESFANSSDVGRALCHGDFDNDGKQDLFVVYADQPAKLFRNVAPDAGHWIGLRLVDQVHGGRFAYGAVAKLQAEDKTWVARVESSGSYCAAHDPRLVFGLGNRTKFESLEITWPDGTQQVITDLAIDQYHSIVQPSEQLEE